MFHLYTLPSTACMKNVTPALPCSELRCHHWGCFGSSEWSERCGSWFLCQNSICWSQGCTPPSKLSSSVWSCHDFSAESYCCYCCSLLFCIWHGCHIIVIQLLFNGYSFHALYPLLVAASSTFLTLDAGYVIMKSSWSQIFMIFRRGRRWCWCRWSPSGPWFRWRSYIPSPPAWPGRTAIDVRMAFVASLQPPWPCSSRLWREIPGGWSPFPWWKPHHGRRFYSSPFWSPSPWECWTWSWQQLDKTGQVLGMMY